MKTKGNDHFICVYNPYHGKAEHHEYNDLDEFLYSLITFKNKKWKVLYSQII